MMRRRTFNDRAWVSIYDERIKTLTQELEQVMRHHAARGAALDVAHNRIRALELLLCRLIDLEGPQPGNVAWAREVQSTLNEPKADSHEHAGR